MTFCSQTTTPAPVSEQQGPARRSRLHVALAGAAALAVVGGGAVLAADHIAGSSDSAQQSHSLAQGWKGRY
ncbi:hypothetical protein [Kitasatospora sp. NPDC059599]|uniref:hypothetical protein n=1 Tax=Kitasatospora sp. NPDC059599 TaxID=3346880 RepID=UPI0036B49067